jgi:DNA-binding response OmpR family regulator
MAAILVISADPNIESLMGQLVAFAGHRPVYDATLGAAGEAIRRVRPDVTMLDIALPPDVVDACLTAAHEVRSAALLTSSIASSAELVAEAASRHAYYFALPGGPRPLARTVQRALEDARQPPQVTLPVTNGDGTVHRALCAALAGIARARVVAIRAEQHRRANDPGTARGGDLADEREGRDALRAAVRDYVKQLKSADLPETRVVANVRTAIADCATIVGAEEALNTVFSQSDDWTRDAYRATRNH